MELATVEVFRFDPKLDGNPRYDVYKAPYDGLSILDVLRYIYEHLDPTLSFRQGCDIGNCGACNLMVNGEPVMCCQAVASQQMKIEPHPKFDVIKDLVVDFNKVREKARVVKSEISPVTSLAHRYDAVTIEKIVVDAEKCTGCGDCTIICPCGVLGIKNRKAIVIDIGSCLGRTCGQCADSCWKAAIKIS